MPLAQPEKQLLWRRLWTLRPGLPQHLLLQWFLLQQRCPIPQKYPRSLCPQRSLPLHKVLLLHQGQPLQIPLLPRLRRQPQQNLRRHQRFRQQQILQSLQRMPRLVSQWRHLRLRYQPSLWSRLFRQPRLRRLFQLNPQSKHSL
jgi:hypothetical protein